MSRPKVAICGVARTPIGKFMGTLSSMSAVDLGVLAVREVCQRVGINPSEGTVDEVIFGQVLTSNNGQNPVFFYEDDPLTGMINIYYSILARLVSPSPS